jgi:uncharacterized protein YbaP (TraB family)
MQMFTRSGLFIYGALKLLLVGLFSLSLNYAVSVSAGEELACTGEDLLVTLASQNPDVVLEMRQKASEAKYGNSRLWKISRNDLPDSWLFGTMHMATNKVSTLPESARTALDRSDKVLVEITDMMDPEKAQATIIKLKHLTFRLDGSTIEADISAQQLEKLKAAIGERALPYELAIRMQPWMLAPAISNQLCEVVAKQQGKLFLDAKIMRIALDNGKELVALETTEEQLSAIASMPKDFQITSLVETLELGEKLDDIKETMKNLYVKGEIGMILPVIRHFSDESMNNIGFKEFQEKLVVQRNLKMAERANSHFEKGNVFMAVGALHLPGENGLVALLERHGFSVETVSTAIN